MCVHTKTYPQTKKFIQIRVLALTGSSPFCLVREFDCDVYQAKVYNLSYVIEEISTGNAIFRAPAKLVIREYITKIIQ